jgi:hypothetical protein
MNKSLAIVLSLVASGTVSAQGMNMPMESKKGESPWVLRRLVDLS